LVPTAAAFGAGDKTAQEEPVVRPVRSIAIEPRALDQSIAVTGTIEARAESSLGFRLAGKLISRAVDVGDSVKAGDILARLDDQDQRNAAVAAQARLAAAEAEQTRARNAEAGQRTLLARGVAPQSEYDAALLGMRTAEAQVDAARADVQVATNRVGYTELTADQDGVVTAVGPDAGQIVQAGDMVVRIARPEEREAVFHVSEAIIRSLPKDPLIEVALAGAPGVAVAGQVRELSPQADPVTRTQTVWVALDNPPDTIRLGATVTGHVKLTGEALVELPGAALIEEQGRTVVWLVDAKSQTVHRKEVVAGRLRDGGPVIVSDGLAKGDIVVTAGVHSLKEGQRVRLAP
jgi:RND family efflux transporter MFP subunit